MTTSITYGDAYSNLEQLCVCDAWPLVNRVVETGEAVIISRPDGNNVALVSEAELSSLLETLYLLRSPANASRLSTALARSKKGNVKPQSMDELYQRFGLEGDERITAG